MTLTIYQADAFTNKLFGGNPAAVIPLKRWLPNETMLQIATENNLAETAFFVPSGEGYHLRWFTPAVEIDLCGHATLATAHILFTELHHAGDTITFQTEQAGDLIVTRKDSQYTLNFPARIPAPAAAPKGLLEAIGGAMPKEIYGSRDFMLVYENEQEVANLRPNFTALAEIDIVGVIATAKGNTVDFVSRFFAPRVGVNEDPVTGSAHCNLIPYWAKKLDKNPLHAHQISARKGELWCEYKDDRVLMTGEAVTYLKGEIYV